MRSQAPAIRASRIARYIHKQAQSKIEEKISQTGPLISYSRAGQPIWTDRNYEGMTRQGYAKCSVVYRCVNLIAGGAAKVPWILRKASTKEEIDDAKHPLWRLLHRPNPWQSGSSFFRGHYAFNLLSGNNYLEGVVGDVSPKPMGPGRPPDQIFSLRPDRMKVVASTVGTPLGYVYQMSGITRKFDADPTNGGGAIIHWKQFNPLNDWYGMSPLESIMDNIDTHNEANAWNKALLQNSGAPSGAMVYAPKGNEGAVLTEEQYNRLKDEVDSSYQGARNAGRPLVLDGGLSWTQMGLSPRDMDWINGQHVSSRFICHGYGVPPYLLGIPGDSTYNNYREARQGLWEDAILPFLDDFCDHMNMTLVPMFGDDLELSYDEDDIPALAPKRAEKWLAVQTANWLTTDEKREATNYEPLGTPESQEVLISSTMTPLTGALDSATDPEDAQDGGVDEAQENDDGSKKPNGKKPNGKDPLSDAAKRARRERQERKLAARLVRINSR